MTEIANELHNLKEHGDVSTESLIEYQERKQKEIVNFLNGAKEKGNIDELSYRRYLLETCTENEWDPTFEHFEKIWTNIFETITQTELQKLSERIIRGAQMIEDEPDQARRRKMMEVYDALLKRMQEISA